MPLLDGLVDGRAEPIEVGRLPQERREVRRVHVELVESRERDGGNVGSRRVRAQSPDELRPVHLGHRQIGDEHVDVRVSVDVCQRAACTVRLEHVGTARSKERPEHVERVVVIVDDEDRAPIEIR